MLNKKMVGSYQIWATQGQGSVLMAKRRTLKEAVKYVTDREGEASWAIKLPDGKYYHWWKADK